MKMRLSPPARILSAQHFAYANRAHAAEASLLASSKRIARKSVTAAAMPVDGRMRITPTYDSWQNEVWGFYERLGELRYVIDWKANLISRIRLHAAKWLPDSDEPVIQEDGLAVDIVNNLQDSEIGQQSQLMLQFATHLNVPGECWLVGESKGKEQSWRVCSSEEIRGKGSKGATFFEIISEDSTPQNVTWRSVATDSMIVRVWRPNKRLRYMADAPVKAALSTMRELELVSRHMQSQYLSRLASAGVLLIPDEVTFPVREEFADAPDPFVREWIETAAEAVKTPGTAASVIPIPMRVPSEYIESFKFLDFTLELDDKIVEKYDKIVSRLATQLDAPPEILLGSGDVNHWSAWAIEESAIKAHILPTVEVITEALTVGYLKPQLKAMGEDPADWVVWYDASEVILRPDRTAAAKDSYDRMTISDEALRRESGFGEEDTPDDEEVKRRVLLKLAGLPATGFQAYDELFGTSVAPDTQATTEVTGEEPLEDSVDEKRHIGEPDTLDDGPDDSALTRRLIRQASLTHAIRVDVGNYELLHPLECREHLASCPFTYKIYRDGLSILPGSIGTYVCELHNGNIGIGERTTADLTKTMIESTLRRNVNGNHRPVVI
jgi:hypothetical protein